MIVVQRGVVQWTTSKFRILWNFQKMVSLFHTFRFFFEICFDGRFVGFEGCKRQISKWSESEEREIERDRKGKKEETFLCEKDGILTWRDANSSVTRFGEILPLWQNFTSQIFESLFLIWQSVEPTLANLVHYWANFNFC